MILSHWPSMLEVCMRRFIIASWVMNHISKPLIQTNMQGNLVMVRLRAEIWSPRCTTELRANVVDLPSTWGINFIFNISNLVSRKALPNIDSLPYPWPHEKVSLPHPRLPPLCLLPLGMNTMRKYWIRSSPSLRVEQVRNFFFIGRDNHGLRTCRCRG